MVEPSVVERPAVVVTGLQRAYDGDEAMFGLLWDEFGRRWDEFEGLAASEEAYGVMTDFDPGTMAFSYLVGVATESPADSPDEFVTVEVPGGSYIEFETTLARFESDYEEVTESWLPESDYERRQGPEYELYGAAFDPESPEESPYTYYVPVEHSV